MNINVAQAREVMAAAEEFYSLAGRDTILNPGDTIVFAEEKGEWLGIVRLCHEHGHHLLRTMQVRPGHQRKSIGSQILERFARQAEEQGISELHLIAFDYLEGFYGKIGFKKVEIGPEFLLERLEVVAEKSPDKKHILMKWCGRDSRVG